MSKTTRVYFRALHTWHDACMPCGGVQPIKRGSVEENRERKRDRKEDLTTSSSDFRHSEDWSLSCQELKSIYSTRVTLQEVWIFLLWLIAFLFGQVFKGMGWVSFWIEI